MALQIRRGIEADRTTIAFLEGEPIYTTDTKKFFVGDGTTMGGIPMVPSLTVNTQDFTASGTWTKPANALWVEVTMCGGGMNGQGGTTAQAGYAGTAGKVAAKTFLASALSSTVSVTCGAAEAFLASTTASRSSFGDLLYAGGGGHSSMLLNGSTSELTIAASALGEQASMFGGIPFNLGESGYHGSAFGGGGGGSGGDSAATSGNGGDGGQAATGKTDVDSKPAQGGGGAGGASGTTGANGSAGGYDSVTGFGHGGGGGGEGTTGAGGNGGAAVRGGGGGGGGKCTTGTSTGGAGGAGFVRVRTLCFG